MTALDGERIVVTGASQGLGRSMTERFVREGASVTLVSRSRDTLDDIAADLADEPGDTLVVTADVREEADAEAAIESTVDAFGGVDTLVNNAAVGLLSLGDGGKRLADVTPDEWATIMETNLTGVYLFSRAALPHMVEQGRGNVLNVSSGLGRRAAPNYAPYVASKFGLEGLTKSVAMEYEDEGVNVNAVDPGGRVNTGFWDHLPDDERESILQADVMDDAAVLLAAQGPDGVTGESADVDEWERRLG
jgi:3-oxoacyl-[acyl-carrier protein] reductase